MSAEDRYKLLSILNKMVWDFQRIPSGKLSNPDDKAAFQAKLYEKINPDTNKAIISATHHPNCAMDDIRTLVNSLPIMFLIRNDIDKYIMTFEDTCGGCERLLSSTVPIFYTCHTTCFLTV